MLPLVGNGGDHGEADAGVAARGLDDGAARCEPPGALRVVDHGAGDAVLGRPSGVCRLELAEHAGGSAREGGEVDEGRGPDQVLDVVGYAHGASFFRGLSVPRINPPHK